MPVIMRGSVLKAWLRPVPATLLRHEVPSALQPRRGCQDDDNAAPNAIAMTPRWFALGLHGPATETAR
jgi:hypothetical protein